jgi:4-hydroxy-2-oxoheptanedioate aldolase
MSSRSTTSHLNLVRQRYQAGELALGTYVTIPAARAVEVLAGTGLDFVRFDPFKFPQHLQTIEKMVEAARHAGMTPWARIGHDAAAIGRLVAGGVQIITVPETDTPAQARAIVAAVRHSSPRTPQLADADPGVDKQRMTSEILIGCQIETEQAIANSRAIIAVEGVDIIHTGRNDIATALGVPGEQFHPRVLAVERSIVEATLEAGKQPSLLYPATEQGLELASKMAAIGVRIFAIDMDYRVLHRAFSDVAKRMRMAP